MVDLTEGLDTRDNSLVADLIRTSISAPLTFGAHAIKGATLGLLDPTQEVAGILGQDIYEAAPKWARHGAEMVGEFVPITTGLGAARAIIPGSTVLPRFLQGALAGTTLGTIRGLTEGEEPGKIAENALLEGLVFGGLEGLTGIPAMMKKRKVPSVFGRGKELQPFEVELVDPMSPAGDALKQDAEAFRYRTSPTPATVARTIEGPLPEAKMIDQTSLRSAMESPNWTDPSHGIYGQKMVLQLWDQDANAIRSIDGYVKKINKTSVTFQDITANEEIRLTPRKLFNAIGSPEARLFVGGRYSHIIPPNMDLMYRAAVNDYNTLVKRLKDSGQLSSNQVSQFLGHINPKAEGINDLSLSEVSRLTRIMSRGAEAAPGEMTVPEAIWDDIGYYGPMARAARVGAWSWFQPADWFVEAYTRKLGGAPWLKNIHNRFLYASQEIKKIKMFVWERFGAKGNGMFKDITEEQRNTIPELMVEIRKRASKYGPGTPHYRGERLNVIQEWYEENSRRFGPTIANKLRRNYRRLRTTFDMWEADLEKAGLLDKTKYKKEQFSFLTASELALEDLYPKGKVPKELLKYIEAEAKGPAEKDLFKMIDRVVSNYTKMAYMKPAMQFMRQQTKGRKVHRDLLRWLDHYSARQYGLPSRIDLMLSESLSTAFKKFPQGIPWASKYFRNFSARDWLQLSILFNDLPYMAHLGLRPFSAMRNLLQPMLTTGPTIGNRWLATGYHEAATNAEGLKWIKEHRLLQESLGEYDMRLSLSPGKLDQFGKFMMGMFRKTDEINRYASGLGMRAKFDYFFNELGMTEEMFTKIKLRRFKPTTREEVRRLAKAYRAAEELTKYGYAADSPRAKALKATVKRLTGENFTTESANNIVERMRVRLAGDAIGDTQWLYGKEHAPIFTHAAGFPGRQLGVYQTWWLNYAQFIKRIMFDFPSKVGESRDFAPLAVWAANNLMITLAFLGLGWEAKRFVNTVFLGPFPASLPEPPAMQPFAHIARGFANTIFKRDINAAEKNFATAFRRAWDNWVPGSLVYKEMAKVGWAPQLSVSGIQLTPQADYLEAGLPEKLAVVVGGKGR